MQAIKHGMDVAGLAGGPQRPLQAIELTAEEKDHLSGVIMETGLLEGLRKDEG